MTDSNFAYDVFLSHSSKDKATVRRVADRLRNDGLKVWFDEWEIRPGDNIPGRIDEGLEQSAVLVLCMSDSSMRSDWAAVESQTFRFTDPVNRDLRFIPLRLDETEPRASLRQFAYIDWRGGGSDEAYARLLAACQRRQEPTVAINPQKVYVKPSRESQETGEMPSVGTVLVGRQKELAGLDEAWRNPNIGVAALIAAGGVGKSTLAWNWWLQLYEQRPELRHRHWSFYNQGATGGSQGDAEAFFNEAFQEWFRVDRPKSRRQQGELIAELVRRDGIVLILDGLEPLQRVHDPDFGSFHDEGMVALLRGLAGPSASLCVCTSRIWLAALDNTANKGSWQIKLDNLTKESGAELFRQYKVDGYREDLERASTAFGNHALSLTLVARFIAEYYKEDHPHINRIDTIPVLTSLPIEKVSDHARRILAHYDSVFLPDSIEYAFLRCLGLFDRPAKPEALKALTDPPPIDGLTVPLQGLKHNSRVTALLRLNRLGLADYKGTTAPLDCHPLIREYFGTQLRANAFAWQEANFRLSRYYSAAAPEEQPTNSKGMEPLYPAVVHASKAKAYAEAWHIYWNRIQQGHPRYFNTNQLGAFHEGLGALASFYDPPWEAVAIGVEEALGSKEYLRLLTEVGFHLKVLGRFDDAVKAIRAAMEGYDRASEFELAAVNSENLAESDLLRGSLTTGFVTLQIGRNGQTYAEMSGKPFRRMQTLALRGQFLFYLGRVEEASQAFFEAEELRVNYCADRQPVRALYILDFLAECGQYEELPAITARFLPLLDENKAKPFTGAFYLFSGQADAMRAIREGSQTFSESARKNLDEAVRLIDGSDLPHLRPWARLARAKLWVFLGDHDKALIDLETALTIAKFSQLRLIEVDCNLGLCNYYLSLNNPDAARTHLELSRPRVVDGDYARPRKWFEAMEAELQRM